MNNVLVFDTETTGLPKHGPQWITQLCIMEYNMEREKVVRLYDKYISLPEGVIIPEFIVGITKITQDMCTNTGTSPVQMLIAFTEAYLRSDTIVSHNLDGFDKVLILMEMSRYCKELDILCPSYKYVFDPTYEAEHGIIHACTMKSSTNLCNIRRSTKLNKNGVIKTRNHWKNPKFPSLKELYRFLFGVEPDILHNAFPDTLNCLKCFIKISPYKGECLENFDVVFADGVMQYGVETEEEQEAELMFEYWTPMIPLRRSMRLMKNV